MALVYDRHTRRWLTDHLLPTATTAEAFAALRNWLCEQHPYDVPEVIAVPVTAGAPDYLAWVASESR